ncbi:1561_t:CDS:2, partial [Racocetra persica]
EFKETGKPICKLCQQQHWYCSNNTFSKAVVNKLTKKRKYEETKEKTEKINKKLKSIKVNADFSNIKEPYFNQEIDIEQEEYKEVDLGWGDLKQEEIKWDQSPKSIFDQVEEDLLEKSSTIRLQANFENRLEERSEEILVNETNDYYFELTLF